MSAQLIVYGAGGHGRVVAEAAQAVGLSFLGFVDDAAMGTLPAQDVPDGAWWVCGVGDNATREQITDRLRSERKVLASVTHPRAEVSPAAVIGEGAYIGPLSLVHTHAELADAVIVNSRAVVEHDCLIGSAAHIAPGATLGGGVRVGARTLIGIGAVVKPGVVIGADATVGAGAVVVRDVPDGATVTGCPAS